MQGTITQDKTRGTWSFVVDVHSDDGARRQMRRRGFRTKKAAAEALATVLAEQARGVFVRPSRTTVAAYLVDEWMPARARSLKPSTAASYEQMIRTYVVPHIGGIELSKVDGPLLNRLYGTLLTDGRTGASGRRGALSTKTVRNVHGLLHRAFKDAVRWRRLTTNPCDAADQPRKASPEMSAWTADQLHQFITATEADRLGPVWRLMATTGMRRGEVVGLRWSDIDLPKGKSARVGEDKVARVRVVQTVAMAGTRPTVGTPKTAAGRRTITLDDETAAALRAHHNRQRAEKLAMGAGWKGADDRVVLEADGSAIHPQVLTRRFITAVRNVEGLPLIRLHDVRHSYATAALAAGVPVKVLSQRLGHADVSITLRTYAHVMPGDDEDAATRVADFIAGRR
jgi:integrase